MRLRTRSLVVALATPVLLASACTGVGAWERDAVEDANRQSVVIHGANADGAAFVVSCRVLIGVADWLIGARGAIPVGIPRSRLTDEAVIAVDGEVLRWPQAFGIKISGGEIRLARQLLVGPFDPPWIKQTMEVLAKGRTATFRFKLSGHRWSWSLDGFAARYAEGGFEPCTGD